MSEELFFAVKTIGLSKRMGRKPQSLLHAARHNRREDQKERGSRVHIDPLRSHLNRTITGPATAADVAAFALALMDRAGVVISRHDYTQAHELLFSLPVVTSIDTAKFFMGCLTWAVDQFGPDNILSADIHYDESAPHCHILILPIVDGRYAGSKLIDRARLAKLRESFAKLALSFGLKEPARRLHGAMKEHAARAVLAYLEATHDVILQCPAWATFKQDIERNPVRYAAAWGVVVPELDTPAKKIKTMVQIFTSAGKGSKVERTRKPIGFEVGGLKPIGFDGGHKNIETIPVLVSANEAAPQPAQKLPAPAPDRQGSADGGDLETVRERYSDLDPALYDPDTGEYFRRPPPARRQRQAADAWVAAGLNQRGLA